MEKYYRVAVLYRNNVEITPVLDEKSVTELRNSLGKNEVIDVSGFDGARFSFVMSEVVCIVQSPPIEPIDGKQGH